MELGLTGKVAVVTGASMGIGEAIARGLAAEGVHLALVARGEDLLNQVAGDIRDKHGVRVCSRPADLATEAGVEQTMDWAMENYSRIDILVNNAGAIQGGTLESMPDAQWLAGWSLKVFGYVRMTRAVFPIMRRQGGGRIVNIIGSGGRQPAAGYLAGGGANAALMNITKALGDEGAPHNILVNAINPGPVRTQRWESLIRTFANQAGLSVQDMEARMVAGVPLKRPGEPEEIANAAVFLASAAASYITGETLQVDGGSVRCI